MPRTTRRTATKLQSKQQQSLLSPYCRVTKPKSAASKGAKQLPGTRVTEQHFEGQSQAAPSIVQSSKSSNKRKACFGSEESEDDEIAAASKAREAALPSTPRKKARTADASVAETPTKGTWSLLKNLDLRITSPAAVIRDAAQLQTPPSSQDLNDEARLPLEIQQMIDLTSTFLSALSLYFAHHGSNSPVDLSSLFPMIERRWGARCVQNDDIRRVLAILKNGSSTAKFLLTDRGRGQICLEVEGRLNERELNESMVDYLEDNWSRATNVLASRFISSLPLHPVGSLTPDARKTDSALARVKSLREELRAGAKNAQSRVNKELDLSTALLSWSANSFASSQQTATRPLLRDAKARSDDLKSRIQAKQLEQQNAQNQLSPEALARKSALHRLHEIRPVLDGMAQARQHHQNDDAVGNGFGLNSGESACRLVSFTLPGAVQAIQNSLRNPISTDEAGQCVRILSELAPEWICLRPIGKVVGVTVNGSGVIGHTDLRRRIDCALEDLWTMRAN